MPVQLLRFGTYFLFCLVWAWLVAAPSDHRQMAIAGFASGVLILSLLMPALRFELDGLIVDAIYYIAAIVAAVLFFIAGEQEQTVIELRQRLEDQEAEHAESVEQLARLVAERDANTEEIRRVSAVRAETEALLVEEWAQGLARDEPSIASALEGDLGLDAFVIRVDTENRQCADLRKVIAGAQMRDQLQQEMDRSIGLNLEEPADLTDSLDFQDILNQQILERCDRVQDVQAQINALQTGYHRLLGLLDLKADYDLLQAQPDLLDTSAPLNDIQSAQIGSIRRLIQEQERRRYLEGVLAGLDQSADEMASKIQADTTRRDQIAAKASETDASLKTALERPLSGPALRVANLMTFNWPYVLITFLGMKIARKPLVPLRKDPSPAKPRTPALILRRRGRRPPSPRTGLPSRRRARRSKRP